MIKNIIKRIIVGVAIALILSFIGNLKPKAMVTSISMPTNEVTILPYLYDFQVAGFNSDSFSGVGNGYLIFNITINQASDLVNLTNVYLERWDTGHINCSINQFANKYYNDQNGYNSKVASVTCPWEEAGSSLRYIYIHVQNGQGTQSTTATYAMSNYISFYSVQDYNTVLSQIANGINGVGGLDDELEAVNTELDGIRDDMNINQRTTWGYFNTIITTLGTNQTQMINTLNTNSQSQVNATNDVNQSVQDMNNTIKDDSVDNPTDYSGNVASNGVITQLITLPITLYTKILNSTSSSCTPFNLGTLYGENLVLPCIVLSDYLGSSLVNVIDILISGLFIYSVSRKMIKVFNSLSSMKESDVVNG